MFIRSVALALVTGLLLLAVDKLGGLMLAVDKLGGLMLAVVTPFLWNRGLEAVGVGVGEVGRDLLGSAWCRYWVLGLLSEAGLLYEFGVDGISFVTDSTLPQPTAPGG